MGFQCEHKARISALEFLRRELNPKVLIFEKPFVCKKCNKSIRIAMKHYNLIRKIGLFIAITTELGLIRLLKPLTGSIIILFLVGVFAFLIILGITDFLFLIFGRFELDQYSDQKMLS